MLKVVGVAGVGAGVGAGRGLGLEPAGGIFRVAAPEVLLAAARKLMAEDRVGTLITVDEEGQPRARSMVVSKPDDNLMLWMGTRPGSRKLTQLTRNPRATLHFAVDAETAYASLMGQARVYRDTRLAAVKSPFDEARRREFFPAFPEDFVLIGFKPEWLEVVADGVAAKGDTWQPQGLRFA